MTGVVASAAGAEAIRVSRVFVPRSEILGANSLTVASDGTVWFTENVTDRIGRFTPSDGLIVEFPLPAARRGAMGIAEGSDGNLWFTENLANRIGRITPSGAVTEFALPTPDRGPLGITSGPDGSLWFTERTKLIGRITPSGVITEFPVPHFPTGGITAGPDGAVWFTLVDAVARMAMDGAVTTFPIPVPPGIDPVTRGPIAVGPDGAMWFPLLLYGPTCCIEVLARVTTGGVFSGLVLPGPAELKGITDLVPGPDGALWFTWGFGIGRITPDRRLTNFLRPPGPSGPSSTVALGARPGGPLWGLGVFGGQTFVARIEPTDLLILSPPSGVYVATQRVDPTGILKPGHVVTQGHLDIDGLSYPSLDLRPPPRLFTSDCLIPGTLLSGGATYRCAGVGLTPGLHLFGVTVNLADGTSVSAGVTWDVLANNEP